MTTETQKLIDSFFTAPQGNSPEEIIKRIQHWVGIANNPAASSPVDADKYAIAAKRRSARQNATRLMKRYPELTKQLGRIAEVA
jgi:hypothetical protein